MPRWSMLLIVVFVIASVVASDPEVKAWSFNTWDAIQPGLADIREGLTVIFHEITNSAPDVPGEKVPPIDDGPVYNTDLARLLIS